MAGEAPVSAVILTRNSARTIRRCMDALLSSTLPPREVVVVDGGSRDGTLGVIAEYKGRARIKVLEDRGKGLGYAREIGWRACDKSSKYVLMLDSDVAIHPRFTEIAVKTMDSDPKLAALASKLKPVLVETGEPSKLDLFQVYNLNNYVQLLQPAYPSEASSVYTACTLYRREALERVGGFNPAFRLGAEDSDLSARLVKAGFKVAYLNTLSLHMESGERFFWRNLRYGRAGAVFYFHHPEKAKRLLLKHGAVLLSVAGAGPFLSLPLYYFQRYYRLCGLARGLPLAHLEALRQTLRALGFLYESFRRAPP